MSDEICHCIVKDHRSSSTTRCSLYVGCLVYNVIATLVNTKYSQMKYVTLQSQKVVMLRRQCEIQSRNKNVSELPNMSEFAEKFTHIWQFTNILFSTL